MAKTVHTTSGARGTKLVSSTGPDTSSYKPDKSGSSIKNDGFGGGMRDISHSIVDGKVRPPR